MVTSRLGCTPSWLVVAVALLFAGVALADDPEKPAGKDPPKTEPAPAEPEVEAPKGPQIEWRASWTEAVEEAAERNVLVYVHSHGST